MLILLDLCGCSGFKLTKGSTPYVIVSVIMINNELDTKKNTEAIQRIKQSLKMQSELNFNKSSIAIKEQFIDAVCELNFEIRILVLDKKNIKNHQFKNNSDLFYAYLVANLIDYNNDIFSEGSILIKSNINRKFKKNLLKQLTEKKLNRPIFSDAKDNLLIQMTNMLAGVVGHYYDEESYTSDQLFNTLVDYKKIKGIWRIIDDLNTLH